MSENQRDNAVRYKCPECGIEVDVFIGDPYYYSDPKWCVECDAMLERL